MISINKTFIFIILILQVFIFSCRENENSLSTKELIIGEWRIDKMNGSDAGFSEYATYLDFQKNGILTLCFPDNECTSTNWEFVINSSTLIELSDYDFLINSHTPLGFTNPPIGYIAIISISNNILTIDAIKKIGSVEYGRITLELSR